MAGRSGDLAVALAHAQLLLCESRQSGVVQQQYLGMFIAVYRALLQQHQQKGEVPPVLEGLAVPRLAGSGNARPQLTIMSAAAIHQQQQDEERMSFPEDVWTAMEVELSKQKRVPHGALRPASGQSIFAVKGIGVARCYVCDTV